MLSLLHVVVDIGLNVGIHTIAIVFLAVFLVLVVFRVVTPSEEFAQLFGRKSEGEVLRHTLETTEASVAPLCAVTHIGRALFVQFVGVCGEDGIHLERIVLPPLQSQVDAHVAPRFLLGSHVVAHVDVEGVDKAQFLVSCRVLVALHLHLEVVAQGEGDGPRLSRRGIAEECARIGRVAFERDVAVGIGLEVGVHVSVFRSTEVGRIVECYARLEDVAYGLYLVAENLTVGYPESVEGGRHGQTEVPVVHIVESVGSVSHHGLLVLVPRLFHLVGVHTVGKGELWRYGNVLEEREVGGNRYAVFPSVAPVLDEVAVHELVLLGGDGVADVSGVGNGYFLVPPLVAHHFLASEGIEACHADIEVGQGYGDGRVAHVLRQVGGSGKCESEARESGAPVYGRCTRTLRHGLRIVERVEVVALIARRCEVDACRQRVVGIGLRVLPVAPLYLEALLP